MDNKVDVKIDSLHQLQEFFYSGDIKFIYFLSILMALDIITGLAKAYKNNNLWSRKSVNGSAKKLLIFCVVIMANIIDNIMNLQNALLTATMLYYIAHECLSIVENCAEMDILVPQQIRDKLKVMNEDNNNKGK